MIRITTRHTDQLVRVINCHFHGTKTTTSRDRIPGFFFLRGLDLYRNGMEAGRILEGSRCILRASTRRELYYKLSAFIDGAEESDRARRVLTGK